MESTRLFSSFASFITDPNATIKINNVISVNIFPPNNANNAYKTQYKINQLFYFNESFDQPINFIRHKP